MKKLLAAMFVALLMVGCGEAQASPSNKKMLFSAIDWDDDETRDRIIAEAIASAMDESKLQARSEKGENLTYLLDDQKPYTGWARHGDSDAIGPVTMLGRFKDGKLEGHMIFRENGNKLKESFLDERH